MGNDLCLLVKDQRRRCLTGKSIHASQTVACPPMYSIACDLGYAAVLLMSSFTFSLSVKLGFQKWTFWICICLLHCVLLKTELEECTETLSQMISRPYLRTPRSKIVQAARNVSSKRHEFLSAVAKGLIPADCSPSLKKKSKIFSVEVDVSHILMMMKEFDRSPEKDLRMMLKRSWEVYFSLWHNALEPWFSALIIRCHLKIKATVSFINPWMWKIRHSYVW